MRRHAAQRLATRLVATAALLCATARKLLAQPLRRWCSKLAALRRGSGAELRLGAEKVQASVNRRAPAPEHGAIRQPPSHVVEHDFPALNHRFF